MRWNQVINSFQYVWDTICKFTYEQPFIFIIILILLIRSSISRIFKSRLKKKYIDPYEWSGNTDNKDFSTTLYFSIGFSIIIYIILFLTAPLISKFYDIELLTPVIRVMSLRIIIASINSVQQAYVAKTLQFKKFFYYQKSDSEILINFVSRFYLFTSLKNFRPIIACSLKIY